MFKTFAVILLVLGIGILLSACMNGMPNVVRGSGKLSTTTQELSGVTGVQLATLGDLTILLGNQESLVIEAEDNLLPLFETKMSSGVLTIQTKPNTSMLTTKPVKYTLTVKSLKSLAVSSSGNISAPTLNVDHFTLAVSSSGKITLAGLQAKRLQASISSSGGITIETGQVDQQTINISSSGNYLAGDVQSVTAQCNISSSGDATIWVTESLTGNLSSSGNINYYGNPRTSVTTSSSGRLNSRGDK